jgi:nitrile hydratase
MNGAHDMGGMQGMGPIVPEPNEPVFHAEWERRTLAMSLATAAYERWNIDMSRFAREDTSAADYLERSYYEMWLDGLEKLLVENGFVDAAEIAKARAGEHAVRIAEPAVTGDDVAAAIARGSTARLDDDVAPAFSVGDRIRVRNDHPRGHTRTPRYVRGHVGVIARDHGVFIFPDSHAVDGDKKPQHVYAVRFTARDLWGEAAAARDSVCVDLWDDYMEPAP